MARNFSIDQDECIGCESCVELAPGAFEMGDDEKAYVKDVGGASEEDIQEAIDTCPTQCISWDD